MSSDDTSWNHAWEQAIPALDKIRARLSEDIPILPRVVRVGQLDAELLDQELVTLLKQPVLTALTLLKSSWAANFELEIALVIQAILYKYSVWEGGATYGAKLQDLCFEKPRRIASRSYAPSGLLQSSLAVHALLTVALPYLHGRIRTYGLSRSWPDAPSSDSRRRAWDLLLRLETLHSTSALVGFISFLWDGKYRTLADRVLGLKLVPARRIVTRNVNYEFMNRQIVWHAFTEFLLFILPIVNLRIYRRRLGRALQQTSSLVAQIVKNVFGTSPASTDPSVKAVKHQRMGKYATLHAESCAICAEDAHTADPTAMRTSSTTAFSASIFTAVSSASSANPTQTSSSPSPPPYPINIPYTTSCGHNYCYYCLTTRIMQATDAGDPGWECLRCCEVVVAANRLEEEVVDFDGSDKWSQNGSNDSGGSASEAAVLAE
ncbi:peroxisome assembly protein (Peroxin-2) [Tulasnella sp. JGI-2019a]|nr:peroxisome assembly protein (Peroxin-2) [Tulasnella sp. JGI-2019a]